MGTVARTIYSPIDRYPSTAEAASLIGYKEWGDEIGEETEGAGFNHMMAKRMIKRLLLHNSVILMNGLKP